MADIYEPKPQEQPEIKTSGISVSNFLSTIRAAQPEETRSLSDEALFNDFIKQYPSEPQISNISGLSLHQMSTIIRAGQDVGNKGDFELVQDFLKEYPSEHARLNTKDKIKLGLSNVAEYLPVAGGVVGGAIPIAMAPTTGGVSLGAESLAVGLGTAAGAIGKDIINRAVGKETPGVIESTAKAANEGIMAGGLNVVGGKIIPALYKSAKPMAAQLIKAFEGVDEKTAIRVIKDPDILSRALPIHEAEIKFGEFIKNTGYKYGPEAVEQVTGDMQLSPQKALDLTNNIFKKIENISASRVIKENPNAIKEITQEALAARTELSDDVTRAFTANLKTKGRFLMQKLDNLDSFLETQIPGYEDARIMYSEAKAKEAFSPMFATNKNGTVSVLRTLGGIVEMVHNPIQGIPLTAASSPYIGGKALQGLSKLNKLPLKPVKNLAASAIAETLLEEENKPEFEKAKSGIFEEKVK